MEIGTRLMGISSGSSNRVVDCSVLGLVAICNGY